MVILYILTGISFAGKSRFARELHAVRAAEIVDPDAVGRGMGLGLHGEFLSDAQWAVIHAEDAARISEVREHEDQRVTPRGRGGAHPSVRTMLNGVVIARFSLTVDPCFQRTRQEGHYRLKE